ncbi:lipase [Paractinoplanes abujensis]|uniref:Putative dienelactone hydrolase n=1 Tax=Paractinoplanes abujensis TaxID=882441 RepID=A0A7W7CMJ1_9ACTN|nr:hydrolase [Actinoplanes abujensis]MBB4691024.1 putative dienelactone hydrolase [Actinoplanes abujensis]GID17563.1 lipase [Actinoplanes abujensis]
MTIAALALAAALLPGPPTPSSLPQPAPSPRGPDSSASASTASPTATAWPTVAAASPSFAPAADIQLTLPAPTGRHPVGTASLHLVDSSRPDPWVPAEKRRELMAQIWYPAATVRGCPRADWVSPQIAARMAPPGSGAILPVTHGHIGAPAAPGRRPVVLWSPGLGMERTSSTALVEELASHGFVVVTVDHTHDANFVEFPDGRLATLAVPVPATPAEEQAVVTKALAVRVADTRFVLNQLTSGRLLRSLPRGLAATLDLNRVGMAGHSLGGATAAEVMRVDHRVRAGANLDGTFFGRPLTTGLNRPFLMLGAGVDDSWTTMWGKLRGPRYWLQLDHTAHLSYTDLQTLLPQLGTPAPDREPLIGSIDGERSIAVQRPYVVAFFDRHLRHGDGRLLAGPSSRYPEMHFHPDF